MLQWSRKLAFCLSLCIYNNIIIKQPNSIHSSPFGAQIDCKGYPPGSFCSLEWSRDAVFLAKSLIFIHYSKSNHCLTKLSLRYASLNPTNQSMSLNVDCHDMSSDRDFCYEYMYRIKALQHISCTFQDFLWQLRKNYRFTMTTVLCAGKGWTLQENYPVAIFFISMYYLILSTTYLSL